MNALVTEMAAKNNAVFEGQIVEVLVEGESKKNADVLSGYTSKNKVVNFRGPKSLVGQIVQVKITKAKTWSLDGEYIEKTAEVNA